MHLTSRRLAFSLLFTLIGLPATTARAQCPNGPANSDSVVPAPAGLFDVFESFPIDSPGQAGLRQSDYTGQGESGTANSTNPAWQDVEYVEVPNIGGFLIAGAYYGFDIYDVRTDAKKQQPIKIYIADGTHDSPFPSFRGSGFGTNSSDPRILPFNRWVPPGEADVIVQNIAAREYNGKIYIALAGVIGMWVWEFDPAAWIQNPGSSSSEGAAPVQIYDLERSISDVEFFFGTDSRLYLAGGSASERRVFLFDVTTMASSPCGQGTDHYTTSSDSTSGCPNGIFERTFAPQPGSGPQFIDAVDPSGSSPPYVVVGRQNSLGAQIWSMANPLQPQSRGVVRGTEFVYGVGLWRQGSTLGLALKTHVAATLEIYDVTNCVTNGTCSSAPRTYTKNGLAIDGGAEPVSASKSDGRVYIWNGSRKNCPQSTIPRSTREVLLDATDIDDVEEITPSATINEGGDQVTYFTWYHPKTNSGFKRFWTKNITFGPGGYMFRAGDIVLDTHRLVDTGPSISVSGDTVAFHGDATTYTASANNCSPSATWNWSTDSGADIQGSGATVQITWNNTAVQSDRIYASNPNCGSPPVEGFLDVDLTDPSPTIQQVRLDGEAITGGSTVEVFQCTVANFEVEAQGRPTLVYTWELSASGAPPNSGTAEYEWPVGNASPGLETLDLEVRNTSGEATFAANLDIQALAALGTPNPIVQQTGGEATFSVDANATGASEWRWEVAPAGTSNFTTVADYGVGTEVQQFSLATGDWIIRVTVRNCLSGAELQATTNTISVTANPPVAAFQPTQSTCFPAPPLGCAANEGDTIDFQNESTGDITGYRYDFTNTSESASGCSFSGGATTNANPSFTYNSEGSYFPCIEARGPGGTDVGMSQRIIISGQSSPASISVTCSPSSVLVNQNTVCSAQASNCSASPSGWNWTTSGGSGNSSTSSITLQWSSAGSKTVRATNSGCGSASGSRNVSVSSGGGGGGGGGGDLAAVISVSNLTPAQNETVTLNGQGSTGDIAAYSWDVRLGNQVVGTYNTAVAQHTFVDAGTHEVRLTVTDQLGCISPSCFASASTTVEVGGNGLIANFTTSPATPEQGDDLVLNAGSSVGDIVAYLWTISPPTGADIALSGQAVVLPLDQAGNYDIDLEVRSEEDCADNGCRAFASGSVNVAASTVLEARYVVQGGGPPLVGKFFTLDADPSTGNPDTYEWELDGQVIPGKTLTVRFDEVGPVPIKLTVRRGSDSDTLLDTLEIVADCDPSDDVLCLFNRRFRVNVTWEDFQGETGIGTPRVESTANSGLFWFFSIDNVEMVVKVLDGCSINNSYWVSLAATTNVAYELTVEDLISGATYTTNNALGNPAPALLDLDALPVCDDATVTTPALSSWYRPSDEEVEAARAADAARELAERVEALEQAARWEAEQASRRATDDTALGLVQSDQAMGTCVPSATTFCFEENRFQVSVNFTDQTGQSGVGLKSVVETSDSGVFYFFDPDNWEMLVKMVEGCGFNDHFWVFSAATTDQEFTLTILDTITGAEQVYFNALKTLAPAVTDIEAFSCSTE